MRGDIGLLRRTQEDHTVWKINNFLHTIQNLKFRFYVKSTLGDYGSAKLAILTYLEALKIDFHGFLHILKVENKSTNFRPQKLQ